MEVIKQLFDFDELSNIDMSSVDIKDIESFKITIRTQFQDSNYSEAIKKWVQKFQEVTATNWIVYKTFPKLQKCLYKKIFKCQHNEKNKSKSNLKSRQRDFKCNASITFIIKKINRGTIKNDPFLLKGLNVVILVSELYYNLLYLYLILFRELFTFKKKSKTLIGGFIITHRVGLVSFSLFATLFVTFQEFFLYLP